MAATYFTNLPHFSSFETTLNYEAARLSSFAQWRSYDKASPINLARAGLVYTGSEDVVKCLSCDFSTGNWNKFMNPMVVHREYNSNCRFFQGGEGVNVPLYVPDSAIYREILENLHQRYCDANTPPAISTDLPDNPSPSSSSISQRRTQTNFPVVATDSGAAETSRQAIGVQGALRALGALGAIRNPDAHRTSGAIGDQASGTSRTVETEPTRDEVVPMKQESNRFASFDNSWPRINAPDPRDLARAGFYYTGTSDRVQCVFCRGILRNWDEDDDPMEEHRRHFPRCTFIMGNEVGNIPDPTVIITEITTSDTVKISGRGDVVSDASLGIVTERPKHPQYAVEAARIASFRNWPSAKTQTPEMLGNAGFFYAGFGDSVKCFFCDGGLRTWEPEDKPWREHARWFPKCPYVRQVKGEDFIRSALGQSSLKGTDKNWNDMSSNEGPDLMNSSDTESGGDDNSEDSESVLKENLKLKEERLCKICLDAEVSVVFLPCGHLLSCVHCSPALRKCPICRVDIKGTVRTFMA